MLLLIYPAIVFVFLAAALHHWLMFNLWSTRSPFHFSTLFQPVWIFLNLLSSPYFLILLTKSFAKDCQRLYWDLDVLCPWISCSTKLPYLTNKEVKLVWQDLFMRNPDCLLLIAACLHKSSQMLFNNLFEDLAQYRYQIVGLYFPFLKMWTTFVLPNLLGPCQSNTFSTIPNSNSIITSASSFNILGWNLWPRNPS